MRKIRKGDNVKVMTGNEAGKQGQVIQVLPKENSLVVENVNLRKKHLKSNSQDQKGQILEFSAPVAISNVQLVCPKCEKTTRVGFKLLEDGRKTRICRKCQETFE